MDEFIDNLLRQDSYCDIQLPRLQVINEKFFELDLGDVDLDELDAEWINLLFSI